MTQQVFQYYFSLSHKTLENVLHGLYYKPVPYRSQGALSYITQLSYLIVLFREHNHLIFGETPALVGFL